MPSVATPTTDVSLSLLDRVRIASPCTAKWEDMTGDERVRHCAQCNLKVHDFSALSSEEVEALLGAHFSPDGAKRTERLCGGWRRRADGTMILGDCPVGLAKVRARVKRSVARACAMLGVTTLLGGMLAFAQRSGWNPREYRSFSLVASWLGGGPAMQQQTFQTLGSVAIDFELIEIKAVDAEVESPIVEIHATTATPAPGAP